jgi:phosphatidylserine/phosphatidylglycerophosphate/cardiolipin synthase-like enzyme
MSSYRRDLPTSILVPGSTCWRIAPSRRLGLVVDAGPYYAALAEVLPKARQRIIVIAWDFDSTIRLRPEDSDETLGGLLRRLVEENPRLDVYILVWRGSIFYGDNAEFPNLFGDNWRDHERIHFAFDDCHPLGGSHHMKLVCIDDALAFVGGMDLTRKRWDDLRHSPDRVRRFGGDDYDPVHDVQVLCDGEAARALTAVAHERWWCSTKDMLPVIGTGPAIWPGSVRAWMPHCPVGIARTLPAYDDQPEVREAEALNLRALAAAHKQIYIETQYYALPEVNEILAAHLQRELGPEIVIVANRRSSGMIEQYVMAQKRDYLFARLRKADRHGRLRLFFPVGCSDTEYEIHIHSKVMVVDDVFFRVGSSNLNGRSTGLDTECDIAVEADSEPCRQSITRFLHELLAEHLGVDVARLSATVALSGSLVRAVDRLNNQPRRLRPYLEEAAPDTVPFGESILDPPQPLDLEYLWGQLVGSKESRAD